MTIDCRMLLGALGTTVAAGLTAPAVTQAEALPAEQRDKVRSGNSMKLFDL